MPNVVLETIALHGEAFNRAYLFGHILIIYRVNTPPVHSETTEDERCLTDGAASMEIAWCFEAGHSAPAINSDIIAFNFHRGLM